MTLDFHNTTTDLNSLWYNSHKSLIKKVATELGAKDKQDELIAKFLGAPLKLKKHKDPNKPTKPKSSFLYFCDKHRSKVRSKNPKMQMGEIMKELGVMWKKCKKKEQFETLAKKAREEYEEKLEEYNLNHFN